MAVFGDSKRDLIVAENAGLTTEVKMLREINVAQKEDIISLRDQLKHTQEALVAKEAPEAYRDRKDLEELQNLPPLTDEEKEQRRISKIRADTIANYAIEMEAPTFRDADDMIEQLTRGTGLDMSEKHSVHENDES